jgi:hypothetical protein
MESYTDHLKYLIKNGHITKKEATEIGLTYLLKIDEKHKHLKREGLNSKKISFLEYENGGYFYSKDERMAEFNRATGQGCGFGVIPIPCMMIFESDEPRDINNPCSCPFHQYTINI